MSGSSGCSRRTSYAEALSRNIFTLHTLTSLPCTPRRMSLAAGRTFARALHRSLPRNTIAKATRLPALHFTNSRVSAASLTSRRPFSSSMTVASGAPTSAPSQPYDKEIVDIAQFASDYEIKSDLAIDTARLVFLDTIGCGLKALEFPECVAMLSPPIPGQVNPHGARVPGTDLELDPIRGAFSIGACVRWLDYNDCWLAAECE